MSSPNLPELLLWSCPFLHLSIPGAYWVEQGTGACNRGSAQPCRSFPSILICCPAGCCLRKATGPDSTALGVSPVWMPGHSRQGWVPCHPEGLLMLGYCLREVGVSSWVGVSFESACHHGCSASQERSQRGKGLESRSQGKGKLREQSVNHPPQEMVVGAGAWCRGQQASVALAGPPNWTALSLDPFFSVPVFVLVLGFRLPLAKPTSPWNCPPSHQKAIPPLPSSGAWFSTILITGACIYWTFALCTMHNISSSSPTMLCCINIIVHFTWTKKTPKAQKEEIRDFLRITQLSNRMKIWWGSFPLTCGLTVGPRLFCAETHSAFSTPPPAASRQEQRLGYLWPLAFDKGLREPVPLT